MAQSTRLLGDLTPSQTVGPFFGFALPYPGGDRLADRGPIRIEGQVLDGDGVPVPDALIEIWHADGRGVYRHGVGFGRCPTDSEGVFHFVTTKPGPSKTSDDRTQAPFLYVTVFARGLLRQLVTRMYFPDEQAANAKDPLLSMVDNGRRPTLIARDEGAALRFDIHLQGPQETVFFAI